MIPPKESMLFLVHMLVLQNDVPGLLRMFHEVCASFLPYAHAALAIETTFISQSRLYLQDAEQRSVRESSLPVAYTELCRQKKIRFLERAYVEQTFPLLGTDCGEDFHVCLLPLRIPLNGYHGTFLLWIAKTTETEHILALRRIIGGVFSVALARVLERNEVQKEPETIKRERDFLMLLQGITASAQSCRDLVSFVDEAASDLCFFFSVRDVALYVAFEDGAFLLICADPDGAASVPRNVRLARKDSLLSRITEDHWTYFPKTALLEMQDKDAAAAFFLSRGSKEACAFPLVVRGQCVATLLVGAEDALLSGAVLDDLNQVAFSLGPIVQSYARESAVEGDVSSFEELTFTTEQISRRPEYADLLGQSKSLAYVLAQVELVAQSDSTVLLLGETGTGKELIAQAVHKRSSRAKNSFITLNCSAVPRDLLESELFGHEKGAFTGATNLHKGRFERAQGGTLFLDEIGELPIDLQPKLLRILQTREMERVGGQTSISLNVRIIAATNRDLKKMVALGQFRDDLYYRLNVFPIRVPPLRERKVDIPLLVTAYVARFAEQMGKSTPAISKQTMAWFCNQEWKGNIRELVNVVERAVIMTTGTELVVPSDTVHFLDTESVLAPAQSTKPEKLPQQRHSASRDPEDLADERESIIAAVRSSNGVIAGPRGAAARLGLKRTTLLSRMKRLNLRVQDILDMGV